MMDIFDSKDSDDAFAARPGVDIIVGGVEDAPRPDVADGGPAPGRGRGYVLDDEAGLDWLFGGAPAEAVHSTRLDFIRPIFDATPDDDGVDPVFVRSRQRRRQRRRA